MVKIPEPKMPGENSHVGRTRLRRRGLLLGGSLLLATPALGGKPSSAASPNSADRRGSSGSRTRSDDNGVCADGGPHGLRLGVASRLCLQPAHGDDEGSRNGSRRRHPPHRSDE